MHDKLRVFANGKGSYDIIAPRVKALIENHRTRPITARVTHQWRNGCCTHLSSPQAGHGFHEIGFAPVTTSPNGCIQ